MPSSEVSMLQLLRNFVADSTKGEASKFSHPRKALKRLRVGETEAYLVAAQRLLLRFRAITAYHNRLHVSELIYFSRFLTED